MSFGKRLKTWLGLGSSAGKAGIPNSGLAPARAVATSSTQTGSRQSDDSTVDVPHGVQVKASISILTPSCVEIAGTTTFALEAVQALVGRRGLAERDMFECQAMLQRDPTNTVDSNAVDVIVDGERIGCLPGYLAARIDLNTGSAMPVLYQLHTCHEDGKLRAKAYVWMGEGTPEWVHDRQNPAALTARERVLETARGHSDLVKEALAAGGSRAAQFQNAMLGGVHYLQLIEPIKQLKREGRLKEALHWCYIAIESAEKDRQGGTPAPAYTWETAIIHRKLGERDQEVAVLKRWLEFCPPRSRADTKIGMRLVKLEASPASKTKPAASSKPSKG